MDAEERSSRDLLDQSKMLVKRGRRLQKKSHERIHRAHHQWHMIAVGRVCLVCATAQAKDSFDDNAPCKAS